MQTAAWPHLAKFLYLLPYFNRPKQAGKVGAVHDTEQVASADELVAGALEDSPCGAYRWNQSKQDRASSLMLLPSSYLPQGNVRARNIALERDFDGCMN
jgi:hypothetical protein